ncbi:hypothetical protein M408DRAFT_332157 [Serendipita vermifera MAFF 305830]|uniref:AB hydrolase-1 domain-containing protein n=1 Tax=Serendipita vermifera MAFF 305830 TaxID=933852 RepID=A0A0C3AGL8_SERVB|nr:hypothetical protein M408DRAFT_332157 [Serendipita vermifera MAFF 305830]
MGKESHVQIPTKSLSTSRLQKIFVVVFSFAAAAWLLAPFDIFPSYPDGDSGCRQNSPSATEAFRWDRLSPTKKLHWVTCYVNFQCARLQVPLNYEDPSAGDAAIALLRYPASVKRTSSKYKGPVLFNPGGPGGSGVGLISVYGPHFQRLLGNEYDIIGFDPRGIGYTTPVVNVFDTPLERASWYLRLLEAPYINETSTALVEVVAKARLINELVAQKVPAAAEHVNTAVVCRDMLSIVQAHGYDKLQYWGFSYGSVLGSTFASLFPDNVGRLIIDGVVDVKNYYAGLWDNNLKVADKGLDTIFKQCAESKDDCAFHESTADKVKDRFFRLIDSLDKKPVTLINGQVAGIINRKIVHGLLFDTLYRPYRAAKQYFAALRALEKGDGLPLYKVAEGLGHDGGPLKCDCSPEPAILTGGQESQSAVMCTDAGPVDYDLDEFQRHFEKVAKTSYFGDIWSQLRLYCVGWKVKPKNPWQGPVGGNTSFPLLLIGNTEDPVTPFAKKMSHEFTDSVVLMQESAGHCSLAAVSLCTAKAIRAYFREGVLPAKGTTCEIEDHMFRDVTAEVSLSLNDEDARILESVRSINEGIRFKHFTF